ncbi:MAG: hypothetical protein Q8O59_04580 [bacterium]|nr:hypothetical protein [bacterium]
MVKPKKIVFTVLLSLIFVSGLFLLGNTTLAEPDKEYRSGQVITIDSKNYIIANNKEFAEIIEIKDDNTLAQVSEVHGMGKIEDLYAGQSMNKYFLVIATGQYLYRYDISDPRAPKIEFKRDLYLFKRGQYRIGSVNVLAGNKDYLFGAGSNGVRSFLRDSLFFYKIYTFDKSYGVAADDYRVYVITENKGTVYNIITGAKLAEVDLENKDKMNRSPYFDSTGNGYFPSDRGLMKVYVHTQEKKSYLNPVPKTETFSYGAAVIPGGNIYYVNGHGITELDKNFNKTKFLHTSKSNLYGANSWAVGITSAKIGTREIIVDFNKSSILLLDKNLKVLSQYKYKKLYSDNVTQDLKITASVTRASSGQKINLRLYGFWPNETVAVTFGSNSYSVKVDNQGYASTDLAVPYQDSQTSLIQAVGDDSRFSYQTSFVVL